MSASGNAYEQALRKVIPAVLIYARLGERVLMIHRNDPGRASTDFHSGKWNGLGGKLEADESPLECARREFFEEAGLQLPLEDFKPLGVIQFPLFKPKKNEDWVVFLFSVELKNLDPPFKNNPWKNSDEGELSWIPYKEVLSLNLWEGDALFLPDVLARRSVMGSIWYDKGRVARHWIQPLSG
ncbi:8-oxo-dGTP diphosphatase [bacterium]|nr:8-oxo-dGTP diphosphatase [bacterium]